MTRCDCEEEEGSSQMNELNNSSKLIN
jgi:hypothetical protein